MKIAFLTSLRTPYRILQVNEFTAIKETEFNVYYTNKQKENRDWDISREKLFNEKDLSGFGLFGKYGYINSGLLTIVKENDVVILGGYEQPTYILMSLLCRVTRTPYILLFDGISRNRLESKERQLKKALKNIVVKHAEALFVNGTVSRRYFNEVFQYPVDKIYNQYLTVDHKTINRLYAQKRELRRAYRQQLGISSDEKVVLYSGRLLDFKNVASIVKALSFTERKGLVFLITGGGDQEKEIRVLAEKFGVRLIVTGFLTDQQELFKHYLAADVFVLPSFVEPWGLVVNEAMLAGLPVVISENCGSSLDLVTPDNGRTFDPYDYKDMAKVIEEVLFQEDYEKMGRVSRDIISDWTFEQSRMNLERIINQITLEKHKLDAEKNAF